MNIKYIYIFTIIVQLSFVSLCFSSELKVDFDERQQMISALRNKYDWVDSDKISIEKFKCEIATKYKIFSISFMNIDPPNHLFGLIFNNKLILFDKFDYNFEDFSLIIDKEQNVVDNSNYILYAKTIVEFFGDGTSLIENIDESIDSKMGLYPERLRLTLKNYKANIQSPSFIELENNNFHLIFYSMDMQFHFLKWDLIINNIGEILNAKVDNITLNDCFVYKLKK